MRLQPGGGLSNAQGVLHLGAAAFTIEMAHGRQRSEFGEDRCAARRPGRRRAAQFHRLSKHTFARTFAQSACFDIVEIGLEAESLVDLRGLRRFITMDRADGRTQPIPRAVHRLDGLTGRLATHCPPDLRDRVGQHLLADIHVGPDTIEQFGAGHDLPVRIGKCHEHGGRLGREPACPNAVGEVARCRVEPPATDLKDR